MRYTFREDIILQGYANQFAEIDQDTLAVRRQAQRAALEARIQQSASKPRVGLMADDFYPIAQALHPDKADPTELNSGMVRAALVIMVQHLQEQNDTLRAQLTALEARVAELEDAR